MGLYATEQGRISIQKMQIHLAPADIEYLPFDHHCS